MAAALLADAGWDVLVLEAQAEPGGAVKSAELVPGYVSDLYSAFYPLSVASPALRDTEPRRPRPAVDARPGRRRTPPRRRRRRRAGDPSRHRPHRTANWTVTSPGDGQRWCDLFEQWQRIKTPLLETLFAPFPPVRGPLSLLRSLGTAEALRLVHLLLLPAGVMAEHLFDGDAARLLLLGNAMHADVPIDAPASGVMGFLLIMMAQDGGFPVPVGGAGQLTAALVRRAESAGARVECGRAGHLDRASAATAPPPSAPPTGRRSGAVGRSSPTRRRHSSTSGCCRADALPASIRRGLDRFVWDTPVLKINYALDAKIPWRSPNLADAGTVHLGADHDGLIRWMADLNTRTLPENPFMLFGQMTTADPTRSAAGTESAWAYTHLPRGLADDESAERLAKRVDDVLERVRAGVRRPRRRQDDATPVGSRGQ